MQHQISVIISWFSSNLLYSISTVILYFTSLGMLFKNGDVKCARAMQNPLTAVDCIHINLNWQELEEYVLY